MDSIDTVDTRALLSDRSDCIGPDPVEQLSEHPLECVETEFPRFARSIDSPSGPGRPSERHPVFYGCFDWHSSVHSHWCPIHGLRLFDDHPRESEIVPSVDARFTAENVEREVEHFDDNESFEKPYGWEWFLRLAAELHCWDDDRADDWSAVLDPLEERIVDLVETDFLAQERPFRVGTHGNSAFALQRILDYARVVSNDVLASAASETASDFFAEDSEYPVEYEPLGWDFLSPALTEADLMRRVLDRGEFVAWIDDFLPDVTVSPYDTILGCPSKWTRDRSRSAGLRST